MMKKMVSIRKWISSLLFASTAFCVPAITNAEDRYAILMGVDTYESGAALEPLQYAASDVERLRDVLIQRGYASDKVIVMTSDKGNKHRPTRENIHRVLSEISKNPEMTADDSVMIVFSGHGFNMNGDSYLCPANFSSANRTTSSLRVSEIVSVMASLPAGSKFMVLDACREEMLQSDLSEFNLNSGLKSMRLNENAQPQGIMFFSSCLAGQVSYEDEELKGGVFMTNFTKGIEGAADFVGNHDQKVSAFELSAYASSMTSDFVRKKKGQNQRPWLDSHTTSDLSVCEISDEEYKRKTKEWGSLTRMSPMEVQAREQANDVLFEALLRFAGGNLDETLRKLSNAIEIDGKHFLARQFRALLLMVQGNNLTLGLEGEQILTVYPKIAEKYRLALDDMKSVGTDLKIPVPDFLPEIKIQREAEVIASAKTGDYIFVRDVMEYNGKYWLEVSSIQRGTNDKNGRSKQTHFDSYGRVYVRMEQVADHRANKVLVNSATQGNSPIATGPQNFQARNVPTGARLERALELYNAGASIAIAAGADLPSIPSPRSFIPSGIGRFLP